MYNWNAGKDLLIDVSIINPFISKHRKHLVEGGVGAAATEHEDFKRKKYKALDQTKYDFTPMIFESTGGVSKEAYKLAKLLENKRREKLCSSSSLDATPDRRNKLLTLINLTVQRCNSEALIQREPVNDIRLTKELHKVKFAVAKRKDRARAVLERENEAEDETKPLKISAMHSKDSMKGNPKKNPPNRKPPLPNTETTIPVNLRGYGKAVRKISPKPPASEEASKMTPSEIDSTSE